MMTFYKVLRGILFRIDGLIMQFAIRASYAMVLSRLRNRNQERKIRVLFLVNECSKWKTQTLYDLMRESKDYEPIIGITQLDIDQRLSEPDQKEKLAITHRFFENRNMATVDMYNYELKKAIDPKTLDADIVFYQQPYVLHDIQQPRNVGLNALTCYVPYYVTNYGTRSFDYEFPFHKIVWRYFILNDDFVKAYRKWTTFFTHVGKLVGAGHTGLDYYYLNRARDLGKNVVVYAPHCSFSHPRNENLENYSTFLWTGERILEYAKKHPEFKWVFRPHPSLRLALGPRVSGVWTDEKIDAYWSEWARIGEVSVGGDYQEILLNSNALITDCGSFLMGYFVIGKPLIHLISPDVKVRPCAVTKRYFDMFYRVRNLDEMESTFQRVLERGDDWMREERLAVLKQSGLCGSFAAHNILDYLNSILHVDARREKGI